MIGESFERASYHFKAIISLIGDQQLGICNTSILLTHKQMCPHHGCIPIQGRSMRAINNHGYQNTTYINVIKDSNLGHYYHKYNVDLCQNEHKFEHSNDHTYVDPCQDFIQYTPSQPREKKYECFQTDTQGLHLVFHKVRFYPCDYNDPKSNIVETT